MRLTLYIGGKWIKQYKICHGGKRTPPATYTIVTKTANPTWTDPNTKQVYKNTDPKNILGTRWMGFNNDGPTESLGIHGTTLPHTIPGTTSNGCVRMYNKEVEELYGFALIGTQVLIRE
jgi:lipoprotein-anchoring transpeptidase ErfK/SrfK